ncbi:hypothetical protein JXQ31_13770 [candidate division KSB1 bacterium]|nr:hypothetical protein [candidate division KSB1 bacterium]
MASHSEIITNVKFNLLDNQNGQWNSVAEAIIDFLQNVSEKEPLIITHQDVIFYDKESFFKIEEYLHEISRDDFYFAGAAGRKNVKGYKEGVGLNNIISGGRETGFIRIEKPEKVDTIDECVIITNRKTIEKYNLFREFKTRWHLYAVDACLTLREKMFDSYVIPVLINHLSRGNCDADFFSLGSYLLSKYNVKEIYTTNGKLTKISVLLRKFKYSVKRKLNF